MLTVKMYKRLTIAQLKKLCDDRDIDCISLRYKREFVTALEQYDAMNDDVIDDVYDRSVASAADAQERASVSDEEGDGSIENAGDVGQLADGDAANDSPTAPQGVDIDAVAILRLRLQVAREERLANEELRRAREEERLAQEMAIEREAQRGTRTADDGARLHGPVDIEFRDIKALLPNMHMGDDILTFLMTYERCLELHNVDRSLWARFLPAQLSQKALKIFARLSLEESRCYDTVKKAILGGFKLNPDEYLKTFRKMRRAGGMSYKAFLTSLRDVATHFYDAKSINSFESLSNAMIMEQFLCSLPDTVRTFVESKQPQTVDQAAEFADLHFQLSQIGREARNNGIVTQRAPGVGPPRFNGPSNPPFKGPAFNGPRQPGRAGDNNIRGERPPPMTAGRGQFYGHPNNAGFNRRLASGRPDGGRHNSAMFNTRGTAYFARDCRRETHNENNMNDSLMYSDVCNEALAKDKSYFEEQTDVYCDIGTGDNGDCVNDVRFSGVCDDNDVIIPVFVNSHRTSALRDTGCSAAIIVDENLVPKRSISYDNTVSCSGAFDRGEKHCLPTADIKIHSPHFGYSKDTVVKAIVTKLPRGVNVIIGNRFFKENPHITDIISVRKTTVRNNGNLGTSSPEVYGRKNDGEGGHRGHGESGSKPCAALSDATAKTTTTGDAQISREIHFERVTANAQYIKPLSETQDAANVGSQGGGRDISSAMVPQNDCTDRTAISNVQALDGDVARRQRARLTADVGGRGGNLTGDTDERQRIITRPTYAAGQGGPEVIRSKFGSPEVTDTGAAQRTDDAHDFSGRTDDTPLDTLAVNTRSSAKRRNEYGEQLIRRDGETTRRRQITRATGADDSDATSRTATAESRTGQNGVPRLRLGARLMRMNT